MLSIVVTINFSFITSSSEENSISLNFAKLIIRFLFSLIILFFYKLTFLRIMQGLDFEGMFFSTLIDLTAEIN